MHASSPDRLASCLRSMIFSNGIGQQSDDITNAPLERAFDLLERFAGGTQPSVDYLPTSRLNTAEQWLLLERCRELPAAAHNELFPVVGQLVTDASSTDELLANALLTDPRSTRVHHLFALSRLAEYVDFNDAIGLERWVHDWRRLDPMAEYALQRIETATLWRMTAPLRWLGIKVHKVRNLWRIMPGIVRDQGGWLSWFRQTWRAGRAHGWAGVQLQLGSLGGNRNNYQRWVKRYDTRSARDKRRIRAKIAELKEPPMISVVLPTYNSDPEWLSAAISSVQKQLYPHWRLCIADDASTNPAVIEVLEAAMRADSRIDVVFRKDNGHIAAATNSALERVTGNWVAFLDHDDLLAEHALYEVARAIDQHPDAALIYSDEDKIDEAGQRRDPYFKPDWNYPLFLSHNVITHLAVYRKSVIDEIEGLRPGYDGSQDYDLALRFIERIRPAQIVHLPQVLYHWRVHSESTAGSVDAKPYAMLAGQRAINEHFERRGIAASVELLEFGYRPRFDLPDPPPKVSIIIPTRNAHELVSQCLRSIAARTTYPDYEVILVDNGSDDPAALAAFAEACERYPSVRCLRDDDSFNFARLCNRGVAEAQGEVVCLLNNDIEVDSPDWLEELVSVACLPEVGAVGGKLLYPNGHIQHAGVVLGIGGWAGHAHKGFPGDHPGYVGRAALLSAFSAVTGACMVVARDRFLAVGGFDEDAFGVACNDVDLCLRLNANGWQSVYVPWAVLYHHESATRGYEDTPQKKARFQAEVARIWERWAEPMADDPGYNPNLSLIFQDFSLAWPPRTRLK